MSNIQDIFYQFYPQYREHYTPYPEQAKVAKDIMGCRTAAMGGHVSECESRGVCGNDDVLWFEGEIRRFDQNI